MENQPQRSTGAAATRPDAATAAIVESAIGLLGTHGREYAAQYLISRGVSLQIIMRVLSDPLQRRQAGA